MNHSLSLDRLRKPYILTFQISQVESFTKVFALFMPYPTIVGPKSKKSPIWQIAVSKSEQGHFRTSSFFFHLFFAISTISFNFCVVFLPWVNINKPQFKPPKQVHEIIIQMIKFLKNTIFFKDFF